MINEFLNSPRLGMLKLEIKSLLPKYFGHNSLNVILKRYH